MEKKKNFNKSFIWNIIGTTFNSFNSLFFMIIVTRINGTNDAGIFTLAYSTACILYIIGVYAGRIFQVTEKEEINDKEYIVNRISTTIIMMIVTVGFVVIKQYDIYKASVFIIVCLYKALEAFSDVLYGILQKNELLYKVGKSFFVKALLSLLTFLIADLITKNLIISSYFDNSFDRISNLEEVENYRRKLYTFKDYLGSSEGYTFFNDYYVSKMEELEQKYNALENGDMLQIEKAIKVISKRENMFRRFIAAIRKLLFGDVGIQEHNSDVD